MNAFVFGPNAPRPHLEHTYSCSAELLSKWSAATSVAALPPTTRKHSKVRQIERIGSTPRYLQRSHAKMQETADNTLDNNDQIYNHLKCN